MSQRFSGKIVLVVGGGRGMGRAIALSFADEGADVVISARAKGPAEETIAALKAKGVRAALVEAELSDRASMKALVEAAAKAFGALDIVVHCAADAAHARIMDMSDETYDNLIRSNVHSLFWIAKDAAPHLSKAKDKGRLIYISSGSANRTFMPGLIPYASTKAYMNAFGRGLAVEFGPMNILVNVVEPGLIASDRMKSELPEAMASAIAANFAIPRVGQSEDIAKAVKFLASNDADYITGTTLLVDGGASMAPMPGLSDQLTAH
jgi:3-oxoacyl-[acyl-carrier protein] reductase